MHGREVPEQIDKPVFTGGYFSEELFIGIAVESLDGPLVLFVQMACRAICTNNSCWVMIGVCFFSMAQQCHPELVEG